MESNPNATTNEAVSNPEAKTAPKVEKPASTLSVRTGLRAGRYFWPGRTA